MTLCSSAVLRSTDAKHRAPTVTLKALWAANCYKSKPLCILEMLPHVRAGSSSRAVGGYTEEPAS